MQPDALGSLVVYSDDISNTNFKEEVTEQIEWKDEI